jgi:hypothetical protein
MLEDHGIWHGDAKAWKDVIMYTLANKLQDAERRKQRKLQL